MRVLGSSIFLCRRIQRTVHCTRRFRVRYPVFSCVLGLMIVLNLLCLPLGRGVESGESGVLIACFCWNPVEPFAGSPVFFDSSCCFCSESGFPPLLNKQVDSLQSVLVEGVFALGQSSVFEEGGAPLSGGGEVVNQQMIQSEESGGVLSGESCISGESRFIASYSWVFGDGGFSDEMNPVHVFEEPGNYSVMLTIVASTGESNSTNMMVNVQSVHEVNMLPVAQSGGPYFGWVDMPVVFDGSGSTDPDGSIVLYSWYFGDGCMGSGSEVSHVYDHSGLYTVQLMVTDDVGGMNTSSTVARVVRDPPVACAGESYSGCVHCSLLFDGSGSFDADGVIVEYSWEFGDGSSANGEVVFHAYDDPGFYMVNLTVVDDDGECGSDTVVAVIVEGCGPSIPEVSGPVVIRVGEEGVYHAVSVDAENDSVCYVFDWGDESEVSSPFFPSGTMLSMGHVWESVGSYCVRVSAVDELSCCSEVAEYFVVVVESGDGVVSGDVSGGVFWFGQFSGLFRSSSGVVLVFVLVGLVGLGAVLVGLRKK